MTILVMCNLGNSDLVADGKRPSKPRPEGEQLWRSFTEHQFELPIIEPCLRFIAGRHPADQLRLVCFYTDQPENPETTKPDRFGVSLRDKDTIWLAHIAQRLIREQFAGQVSEVEIVRIENSRGPDLNPSVYDEVFEAYAYLLQRFVNQQVDRCYILTAGGIPACNFALQLQAMIAFADRCHFIYPPEGGKVTELRIGEEMSKAFQRVNALNALDQRNFPAALLSARAAQVGEWIIALLEYAVYREAFDFQQAMQAGARAQRHSSGSIREFCRELQDDLQQLIRNDAAALLREVAYSADIAYRNGRYADLLGRLFRFQEGVLRLIVEKYLGLPTDFSKEQREASLARYLEQIDGNPALRDFLDQRTLDGKPLRYRDGPNRPVMQALLEFVLNGGTRADGTPFATKKDRERLSGVRERLNRLDALAELRNQSVIAHGFAGVAREAIDSAYKGGADQIVPDLYKMIELLDSPVHESPFDRIAGKVQRELRRGS
ncbi:hypothetical protein [Chloroflexus aurantiacus]